MALQTPLQSRTLQPKPRRTIPSYRRKRRRRQRIPAVLFRARLLLLPAPPGRHPASLPASSSTSKKSSSSKSAAKVARPLPTDPQNSGAEAAPSPLSFSIGSAKFTPGGFVDLTNFFRSKDIGSGIGTSFNGVPYNNSLPLAALTEDHFSLQNSRLTLRVDSTVAGGSALGYVEADFLGFTNDNLNVTSNSDTLAACASTSSTIARARFEFLADRTGACSRQVERV